MKDALNKRAMFYNMLQEAPAKQECSLYTFCNDQMLIVQYQKKERNRRVGGILGINHL